MGRNSKKIQVLETQCNVWNIIEKLTSTGLQNDAFYICDLSDIVKKYKIWKDLLPRVEPFYAVKCNPFRVVLELLAQLGAGFDCASKDEIKTILSLNIDPNRIIFANPTKIHTHLSYSSSFGVNKMTFDSEDELIKIKNIQPQAEIILRIRYDDPDAKFSLGRKFGCNPYSSEPINLFNLAKKLELNVIGVCFHIGSSSENPKIFHEAIKVASEIFKLGCSIGFKLTLLDIGGGFLGEHGTSLLETANIINKALDDFFPDPSIKIISEPGRYFVSSAFTLATNIHSLKCVEGGNNEKYFMYYINCGVYNTFLSKIFNEYYHPQPLKYEKLDKKYGSTIWGPTCDSTDMIVDQILLPEMKIGDWIVFKDAGAYTYSIRTKFNGFRNPKIKIVIDQITWNLIRNTTYFPINRFLFGNTIENLFSGLK